MKKLFITLIIFGFSWIHACTLCGDSTQFIKISVHESHNNKSMKLDIQWDFTKQFSAEALLDYDINGNKSLEQNELANIHQMIMDYLQAEHYLTYMKYVPSHKEYSQIEHLPYTPSNEKTTFSNHILRFSYTLDTNLTPTENHLLYLSFFDKASFFSFKIDKLEQASAQDKNSSAFLENSASFQLAVNQQTPVTSLDSLLPQNQKDTQPNGMLGWLSQQLKETKEKVVLLLEEIKEKENVHAYFWLLLFSLLYGIIHAIGPGHGKSLVAAYFLGNNRSISKAFSISALIGVVHTFSAFLLTFSIYYILHTYMTQYFSNIESITTKISAVIIILIALYLLYKKIPKRPKKVMAQPLFSWSQTKPQLPHEQSCGCGACQSNSTDIGVILSAGIIPCPGTVTIFIFTLSLGVYWVGLLSAIFMSIGMSLVIFVAAYLSLKIRENTTPNIRVRQILDYGSLVFILSLGLLLFIAS